MKKKEKAAKTKATPPKKMIILPALLIIALVLVFIFPRGEKASLPEVKGWAMQEMDAYSPEGFTIKEAIYKSGEKYVRLTAVSSGDETTTKNKLEAMAHSSLEDEKEERDAVVGKYEAKYISDGTFSIIFFTAGKSGYVATGQDSQTLEEFLKEIYGNVFIDI